MDEPAILPNNVLHKKYHQATAQGEQSMFGFFKRSTPSKTALTRREVAPSRKPAQRRGVDLLAPLPTPEVTEGNDEADWSLWEDSVAFQDSQMPSTYPETRPLALESGRSHDADDSVMHTAYDTLRGSDL
jgi:hypothetical protein